MAEDSQVAGRPQRGRRRNRHRSSGRGRGAGREETEITREPVRDELGRAYATGKRKDAVARVWIKPGSGKVTVNGKDLDVYFARPVLQMILRQAFTVAGVEGQFDVQATVKGGGLSGSGRCGQARHLEGAAALRSLAAPCAESRRLPHPRQPHGRAEEVRQAPRPARASSSPSVKALPTRFSPPSAGHSGTAKRASKARTNWRGLSFFKGR